MKRSLGALLLVLSLAWPQDNGGFGFSGLEIYKADFATLNLGIADFNGDGLNDFAVVNNQRATIDLYLQKTKADFEADKKKPPAYDRVNELPSDARFKKESVLTEKKVFSFRAGDLNNDAKPDLAFYGDPKELVVLYRTDKGYDKRQRFDIKDGSLFQDAIVIADYNGDMLNDLVLLGVTRTYVLYQTDKGELAKPVELANSDKEMVWIDVADVDGDGLKDLVYLKAGTTQPLRVRFQQKGGLGPEVFFELPMPRFTFFKDLNGDKADDVLNIGEITGRLQMYRLTKMRAAGAIDFGTSTVFPLSAQEPRRVLTVGDVNNDGRKDIVAAYPDSSALEVYFQDEKGRLMQPERYSTYSGVSQLQVVDTDQDGKNEIVLLSREEGVVGGCVWDGKRVTFPATLVKVDRPFAFRFYKGNDRQVLVVVNKPKDDYLFNVWRRVKTELQSVVTLKLDKLRDEPVDVAVRDLNADTVIDYMIFTASQPPVIVLAVETDEKNPFKEMDSEALGGKGILYGTRTQATAFADVNGDAREEMIVSKKNFARALTLDKNALMPVEQINLKDSGADIAAMAAFDFDLDRAVELVLVDRTAAEAHVLRRNAKSLYDSHAVLKIPPMKIKEVFVDDLNGDAKADIVVAGDDKFAIYYNGADRFELTPVAGYEHDEKDARLEIITTGNLNGDAATEVVVVDNKKRTFEILQLKNDKEFERKLRFEIWEEKRGISGGGPGGVREVVVGDVTGDGLPDVLLLIHDRILLYVQ